MKRFASAVVIAMLLCTLGGPASAQESETSSDEATLYALGFAMSRNLSTLEITESELEQIQRGLTDGTLGRQPAVDIQAEMQKLQTFVQQRTQQVAAGNRERSARFVEQAAAESGAERTDSGLVYTEVAAGSGAAPAAGDTVTVHYHGTLANGTVFDSSRERGEPVSFGLGGVIPCWQEGLLKMKVGGKSRLVCPPDLAYGDRGAPPTIPPGAALVFEVELLSIGTEDEAGD